jgi:hypothetical protein
MLAARIGIAIALAACAGCAEVPPPRIASGASDSVDNAEAAIRIARLAWIGAHPELADRIGSEAEWQAIERATLDHGVWTVWDPVPSGAIGGSLYILIAQADGRVIQVYLTQ